MYWKLKLYGRKFYEIIINFPKLNISKFQKEECHYEISLKRTASLYLQMLNYEKENTIE